ncbi:Tat (twin-arginine translocation) pathway signal sequence [Rhizobium sp. NFR07]|nr:Tat (twin-arginine translocation) pathway signal sequence [Rhizobium sp. NFR07]
MFAPATSLSRRSFMGGVCATAALAATRGFAQQSNEVVLSGGHIVSMDPDIGDLERGDILIRDGAIAEIAPSISGGARRIDMAGRVVMPGFVDTHWHMWNTIARGLPRSRLGPFGKTMPALAKVWTPQASALSIRLAVAEAVNSGITTIHNWAHNTAGLEFAEAELEAMRASGLRGRFSHGYPQLLKLGDRMDFAALEDFQRRHFGGEGQGADMIELGLCTREPDRSQDAIWREEWEIARRLGIPVTTHIASDRKAAAMGSIRKMADSNLLGPDIQLMHATHASDEDLALVKKAGSPVSISPWTELEVGYGVPPAARLAASGVEMGLSVDNMVLAGNADMFSVMKLTADLAAGSAEKQAVLPDRKVLERAMISGARTLGLNDVTGSLKVGKRADIIAARADGINTRPAGTIDFMLTHAAQPANVDLVMVDGEIHKENSRLARIDGAALTAEADEMIAHFSEQAGLTDG